MPRQVSAEDRHPRLVAKGSRGIGRGKGLRSSLNSAPQSEASADAGLLKRVTGPTERLESTISRPLVESQMEFSCQGLQPGLVAHAAGEIKIKVLAHETVGQAGKAIERALYPGAEVLERAPDPGGMVGQGVYADEPPRAFPAAPGCCPRPAIPRISFNCF